MINIQMIYPYPDDRLAPKFGMAKQAADLTSEGWKFQCQTPDGCMIFARDLEQERFDRYWRELWGTTLPRVAITAALVIIIGSFGIAFGPILTGMQ